MGKEILRSASAGAVKNNDVRISIAPSQTGAVEVTVESAVKRAFGGQIAQAIRETAAAQGVTDAAFTAEDRGALDFVIRARTETAILRATSREGV